MGTDKTTIMPNKQIIALMWQPSKVLDSAETMGGAAGHIAAAVREGRAGRRLVVFSKSWLSSCAHRRLATRGVTQPGAQVSGIGRDLTIRQCSTRTNNDTNDDLTPLRAAAKDHVVTAVVGFNEHSARTGGAVYNTLLLTTIGT